MYRYDGVINSTIIGNIDPEFDDCLKKRGGCLRGHFNDAQGLEIQCPKWTGPRQPG
ncbi:MAG: hypothetical protein WA667_04225 [Candidatus Nitrosopolaris sp.]